MFFVLFLTITEPFFIHITAIYIEIDIIFGISTEHWVDSYMFQMILRIFGFIEKNTRTPSLSGNYWKMMFVENAVFSVDPKIRCSKTTVEVKGQKSNL
jgi:hypothetical protein